VTLKVFADGVSLPESDLNVVSRQTVIVCTSLTRPPSPNIGMCVYETDTAEFKVFTSTVLGWTRPWTMPWGIVGQSAEVTSPSGAVGSTSTRITALDVTFNQVRGRKYRHTVFFEAYDSSANVWYRTWNVVNGQTPDHNSVYHNPNAALQLRHNATRVYTASSTVDNQTCQFWIQNDTLHGASLVVYATSTEFNQAYVEDLGPAIAVY
jgi:hypothetical protein